MSTVSVSKLLTGSGRHGGFIRNVQNNLRFPGQYYDTESGLHQNWHRDYDPKLGRYLEADPIGLKGGMNLYSYASLKPTQLADYCGLDANTWTYGEIRTWAIRCPPSDLTAPAGLADAKASIGATCARGNSCSSVDGSAATGWDLAAWRNIVNAAGGSDQSGGADYMCTDYSCYITQCYTCCAGEKRRVQRIAPLQTTGSVAVSSCQGGTVYFYNDPYQGWCSREEYLQGCH